MEDQTKVRVGAMLFSSGEIWNGCTYSGVPGKLVNLLPVFVGQLESRELIFLFADAVCLDDGAEDREAVLDVQRGIVAVTVHTCSSNWLLPHNSCSKPY